MSNVVAEFVAKLGLKPDAKSWSKGDELISGMKKAVLAFVGIKAVEKIGDMVAATVELGGHLDDMSQKTGLSVEALQEWGYAAKLSGADADGVAAGISKFARGLDEATRTGKGPAAEAVHYRDWPFMDVIPVFNQGKDGLKELTDEFKSFELSTKDVGMLDKFGDDIDKTKLQITGLKNQAIAKLIPVLQPLLDSFREWVMTNRELIASTIKDVVAALIVGFKFLAAAVGVVVDIFKFFIDNAELGKSVLIGLGSVLAAWAIGAAAAWVMAMGPIILAIAAVSALVLGIRALIKNWDKVKDAFRRAGSAIWNALKDAGARIKKFFVEDIPNAIVGAFDRAWDAVVAGAKRIGHELRNLPVIKQIGDVGEFLGTGAAKAVKAIRGDNDNPDPMAPGNTFQKPGPARGDGPHAMATPIQIRGGDIKVEVNATGGDPVAMANEINKRIGEHMDTLLQQTAEAIG